MKVIYLHNIWVQIFLGLLPPLTRPGTHSHHELYLKHHSLLANLNHFRLCNLNPIHHITLLLNRTNRARPHLSLFPNYLNPYIPYPSSRGGLQARIFLLNVGERDTVLDLFMVGQGLDGTFPKVVEGTEAIAKS